jgi:hypothetical protein
MPTAPARIASAPPPSMAAAGLRAWRRTATAGATSTASTSRFPRPWTATATAAARSASRAKPTSSGRSPSAPEQREGGRRDQIAVAHGEGIAEQELLEPLGSVRGKSEQGPQPQHPGDHHSGRGVRAYALVPSGHGDEDCRQPHARRRPEQERRPRKRGHYQPRQQSVGERLRSVAQPPADHPEGQRAADCPEQGHVEQGPASDAGAPGVEQEIEQLHINARGAAP